MPKSKSKSNTKPIGGASSDTATLKGWKQIAEFLGEPSSVVQRWAATGMPVRREVQFVSTTVKELNDWLGKQSGKPVHVVTDDTDLGAELKRGLSYVRHKR